MSKFAKILIVLSICVNFFGLSVLPVSAAGTLCTISNKDAPSVVITHPYYLMYLKFYTNPNIYRMIILQSDEPIKTYNFSRLDRVYTEGGADIYYREYANNSGDVYSYTDGNLLYEYTKKEIITYVDLGAGCGGDGHAVYSNHDIYNKEGKLVFQGPLATDQGMIQATWWTATWILITRNAPTVIVAVSLTLLVLFLVRLVISLKKSMTL